MCTHEPVHVEVCKIWWLHVIYRNYSNVMEWYEVVLNGFSNLLFVLKISLASQWFHWSIHQHVLQFQSCDNQCLVFFLCIGKTQVFRYVIQGLSREAQLECLDLFGALARTTNDSRIIYNNRITHSWTNVSQANNRPQRSRTNMLYDNFMVQPPVLFTSQWSLLMFIHIRSRLFVTLTSEC